MEELLRAWVPLLVSIIALGTSGWGVLQGPARKNATAIQKLADNLGLLIDNMRTRLDVTEKDVALLKQTVQQMPTADDFHVLDKGMTEVRGKMDTISASQRASERSLERIENVLITMAGPGK